MKKAGPRHSRTLLLRRTPFSHVERFHHGGAEPRGILTKKVGQKEHGDDREQLMHSFTMMIHFHYRPAGRTART